jgi:hypothetical protein
MHSLPVRPVFLLQVIVLLAASAGCSATRGDDQAPPWSRNPASGLDERVVLAGVGSAHGADADAAEAARRAAMAAILEQLVAHVDAQTSSLQSELSLEQLDARGLDQSIVSSELRERIINVSSEGELHGTRFELVRAEGTNGPLSWARAVVDRGEMAESMLAIVREDISRAGTAIESARRALDRGGAPSALVARGLQDALAGDQALVAPRAALPLLRAIRPDRSSRAASEIARIASLDQGVGELLARIAIRLDVSLVEEARVGFGGQLLPIRLQADWDGMALPGLLLAARFGTGPAASGRTDADGRVALSVPAPQPGFPVDSGLRVGPDIDGQLAVIRFALPVSFPRPADSRIAVYSLHERMDASGSGPLAVDPSPLQGEVEELLGGLKFPVIVADVPSGADVLAPALVAKLAGRADYVLQLATRTVYSSADSSRGPIWYRSSLEIRLTEVATGETLTVTIAERETKAAGATADQAADRSLAAAFAALSRADDPDSLISVLRARFR